VPAARIEKPPIMEEEYGQNGNDPQPIQIVSALGIFCAMMSSILIVTVGLHLLV